MEDAQNMPPNLKRGIAYLKTELKTLPSQPGVYRMQNAVGEVLYVGKARNLVLAALQTTPSQIAYPTGSCAWLAKPKN